ncbi:MAG: hypothetical protein WBD31_05515 [Rubripirellula sp.]
MNGQNDSRALLLEQLESRCMLAAGLISFSTGNARHESVRHETVDAASGRPAMVDLHSVSRMDNHRDHGRDAGNENGFPQHSRRAPLSGSSPQNGSLFGGVPSSHSQSTSPQIALSQNQSAQPFNSVSRSSSKLTVQTVLVLTPLASNLSNLELGREADSKSSSAQEAAPRETMTALVAAAARSEVKATPDSQAAKSDKLNPSASAPVSAPISPDGLVAPVLADGVVAEATFDPTAADQSSLQTNPNTISSVGFDTVELGFVDLDPTSRDQAGGSIDTVPLLRHEFDQDRTASADEAWEVDAELLDELREIARDTSRYERIAEDPVSIDIAIAQWFGQSTGLIDDIQLGSDLPSISGPAMPSMVDVVLDATLGLHRSVSLIANAQPESVPNNVRDAILAAIAAQQPVLIDSVAEPGQSRVAGMAYPGVAIVASTLAVASRRQKNAKLESSR